MPYKFTRSLFSNTPTASGRVWRGSRSEICVLSIGIRRHQRIRSRALVRVAQSRGMAVLGQILRHFSVFGAGFCSAFCSAYPRASFDVGIADIVT
jgi:hypothetical protein